MTAGDDDDDLADFNDDDLFGNDSKPIPVADSAQPTPIVKRTSSSASSAAVGGSGGGGGWRQFNAADSTPAPKRERLAPSSHSHGASSSSLSSTTPHASVAADLRCTILVSKLPHEVKMSKLALHFEQFGTIVELSLDRAQNRGLVRFAHHSSAQSAIKVPYQIYNHRMVLDRVKDGSNNAGEDDNNNNAEDKADDEQQQQQPKLVDVANALLAAVDAKMRGQEHAVVAVTLEHTECSNGGGGGYGGGARMSYRAPEQPAAQDEPAAAPAKPKADPALQREVQKAHLKLLVEEKNLTIAKKALATCREGMNQAKDKLERISKDPHLRSEIIAEVTSFAIEIKTAQASVIQAEATVQASKRELERLKQQQQQQQTAPSPPPPPPAATTTTSGGE